MLAAAVSNFADLLRTCLLPILLVGLASLSQPNSRSTFHHFLLAAEIRSLLHCCIHRTSSRFWLLLAPACLGHHRTAFLSENDPRNLSVFPWKTREKRSANKFKLLLPNQCVLTNLHDRLSLVFSLSFYWGQKRACLGSQGQACLCGWASLGVPITALYSQAALSQRRAEQLVSGRQGEAWYRRQTDRVRYGATVC